jgi:hypothetical protein
MMNKRCHATWVGGSSLNPCILFSVMCCVPPISSVLCVGGYFCGGNLFLVLFCNRLVCWASGGFGFDGKRWFGLKSFLFCGLGVQLEGVCGRFVYNDGTKLYHL